MSTIGVICRPHQRAAATELFELLKVPWAWADGTEGYQVLLMTGSDAPPPTLAAGIVIQFDSVGREARRTLLVVDEIRIPLYAGSKVVTAPGAVVAVDAEGNALGTMQQTAGGTVLVLGYDLLDEVTYLLENGQTVENAATPALDLHIELLRGWVVDAGIPLVEIAPNPYGHPFIVCLTHDIDFFGIRRHGFDHTVLGFLLRATLGTFGGFFRGRRTWQQLRRNLAAVAKLPLVHLRLTHDFWQPFADYRQADRELPSTFFVIPFKDRPGDRISGTRSKLRATRYDVRDVAAHVRDAEKAGCEVAVHGIDAWHNAAAGRAERAAVEAVVPRSPLGIRMHWLCYEHDTPMHLEAAGFAWDATFGYNDAVGYRAGTTQIYVPPGADYLPEVPLHIQDTALFLARRLDLAEDDAWEACARIREHARDHGGVLTITWHDRSLAPERLWGEFYARLLDALRTDGPWFATISSAVAWAQVRRDAAFVAVETADDLVRVHLHARLEQRYPPLLIKVRFRGYENRLVTYEVPWHGEPVLDLPLLDR